MDYLQQINKNIIPKNELPQLVASWKNKKIVFTNGCFDILHQGHIQYLAKAANLGDKFIVGINSDSSVKQLNKGTSRPLQDEYSRAIIIAALKFVDAVIIFDEATPFELIKTIQPTILVKGGDYDSTITNQTNKKYIVGSDIVKANNGEVVVIPFLEGYSTTKIEEKIKCGNQ